LYLRCANVGYVSSNLLAPLGRATANQAAIAHSLSRVRVRPRPMHTDVLDRINPTAYDDHLLDADEQMYVA
jgi:hypothetical protein